jgi:uncharacterized protein
MLPDELVAIMVCPRSKQPVVYFPRGEADRDEADGFLFCPASRLRYPIQDGVPVMLVEEATEVSASAAAELVARAKELGLPVPGADGASARASR